MLALLNYLYKRTNIFKAQFIDAEKFLTLDEKQQFDAVNLGSNQALFGFDYDDAGLNGMNWAVSPNSLEYDFKILKQYHSHLKENAFVIIPVCPFLFFAMFGHKKNFENYKYYRFLKPDLIHNYSFWVNLTFRRWPVFSAGRTLINIFLKKRDQAAQHSKLSIDTNPMDDAGMESDAAEMIRRWLGSFSLSRIDAIRLSARNKKNIEQNIVILGDMIDFCLENKYKPVIMLLPVMVELFRLLPVSFQEEYIMNPLKKANVKDVPVLNYLNDERFLSHELYLNCWWFNAKGRRFFTNIIMRELHDTYNG